MYGMGWGWGLGFGVWGLGFGVWGGGAGERQPHTADRPLLVLTHRRRRPPRPVTPLPLLFTQVLDASRATDLAASAAADGAAESAAGEEAAGGGGGGGGRGGGGGQAMVSAAVLASTSELGWERRVRIAAGMAMGMATLYRFVFFVNADLDLDDSRSVPPNI